MNCLKQIRADLDKQGESLTYDMFKDTVIITHQDGSKFHLMNVVVERKQYGQLDVYLIWTKHCGYFYFFECDLGHFHKYQYHGF